MSKWVKCSERLPETSDNYIIFSKGNDKTYQCSYEADKKRWYHSIGGYLYPTHWREMPAIPEDDE